MNIIVTEGRHRCIVELRGRFDAHEVEGFVAALGQLTERGTRDYGIDLSAVDFIDSSALAALVSLDRRATAAGGTIELQRPSDPVRVILELTGLDGAFVIDDADDSSPIAGR